MKVSFEKAAGKFYVAKIKGICQRYGLDREFIEKPAVSDDSALLEFSLADGLYEVCSGDNRTYIAIVSDEATRLHTSDIESARDDCKSAGLSLTKVFREWVESGDRTSARFAELANGEAQKVRARLRAATKESRKAAAEERRKRVRVMTARQAFDGSDAADTRAFLGRVEKAGPLGKLAAELFRCQKASTRAKLYRGDYRDLAYDRKGDVLARLCEVLAGETLVWGWKIDPAQSFAPWVLYVELPHGQVSFHSVSRGNGPDYGSDWDGQHASEKRILTFCDSILLKAKEHASV